MLNNLSVPNPRKTVRSEHVHEHPDVHSIKPLLSMLDEDLVLLYQGEEALLMLCSVFNAHVLYSEGA